ncbi:MAG: hypothetical protein Fur0016_00060 [Anaerolineales bacterium]
MTQKSTYQISQLKFVQYHPNTEIDLIKRHWKSLLQACPQHYFLSWGWISTWLNSLPAKHNVRLIVGFMGDEPALAFFAGLSSKKWMKLFRTKVVSLNTTGIPFFDKIYLEYNTIVMRPDLKANAQELLCALHGLDWDEFWLPGLSMQFIEQFSEFLDEKKIAAVLEEKSAAPYVDLQQVREAEMDYLRLISANKRSQIRRSIKEYEKDGPINIQAAQTPEQALLFLDNLASLHNKEWRQRGVEGAFSNEYFYQFHKNLITARFSSGEIQLLRIATPVTEIGYLYNFTDQNRVYFYQSGFNYLPGNVYRPGLVSHYYAILHYAYAGKSVYDFMAGEADYKTSMATSAEEMYWVRVFRNRALFIAWKWLSALKTRAKSAPATARVLKKLKKIAFSSEN